MNILDILNLLTTIKQINSHICVYFYVRFRAIIMYENKAKNHHLKSLHMRKALPGGTDQNKSINLE